MKMCFTLQFNTKNNWLCHGSEIVTMSFYNSNLPMANPRASSMMPMIPNGTGLATMNWFYLSDVDLLQGAHLFFAHQVNGTMYKGSFSVV
jgi:hypothetical protein